LDLSEERTAEEAASPESVPEKDEKRGDPTDDTRELLRVGAGVTALVVIFSAVAFTGVLGRTWRNHLWFTLFAFFLVLIALAVWTVGPKLGPAPTAPAGRWRRLAAIPGRMRSKGWAVVAYAIGVGIGVAVVGFTYSDREKPTITAEVQPGLALKATVRVAGLSSNQKLAVDVKGYRREDDSSKWEGFTIYEAAFGPDASGEVEHPIRLGIAPGTYDLVGIRAGVGDKLQECPPDTVKTPLPGRGGEDTGKAALSTGCLFLALPRQAPFPRVTLQSAKAAGRRREVIARVLAENTPHRVFIYLIGLPGRRQLTSGLFMPDPQGSLEVELRVNVPRAVRRVCAIARWHQSGFDKNRLSTPYCPPHTNKRTSWVNLSLPPARAN
jgi:hypothetical protein